MIAVHNPFNEEQATLLLLAGARWYPHPYSRTITIDVIHGQRVASAEIEMPVVTEELRGFLTALLEQVQAA
jgi:hypothetical protein